MLNKPFSFTYNFKDNIHEFKSLDVITYIFLFFVCVQRISIGHNTSQSKTNKGFMIHVLTILIYFQMLSSNVKGFFNLFVVCELLI